MDLRGQGARQAKLVELLLTSTVRTSTASVAPGYTGTNECLIIYIGTTTYQVSEQSASHCRAAALRFFPFTLRYVLFCNDICLFGLPPQ